MYAIKMDADKNLVTTVHSVIYRGENNADTLTFLLPQVYETIDISDCAVLMRYILPDGTGRSEELERNSNPYNENYYKYKLKVASRFTETAGDIELWITVIGFDDAAVLKTEATIVEISSSRNISDYLSGDSIDQIDRMALQIKQLERDKADNLIYDADDKTLQLTSNGDLIGDAVDLDVMP